MFINSFELKFFNLFNDFENNIINILKHHFKREITNFIFNFII